MQLRSACFVVLMLVLMSVAFPHSPTHAQCQGICGDVNGSNTFSGGDVTALFNHIIHQVPLQVTECADLDYHQNITINDAYFLAEWAVHGEGLLNNCDPGAPPHVPIPSDSIFVYYDDRFPSGDSQVVFDLMFQVVPEAVYRNGISLPFLVDVSGDVPDVEVLQNDPDGRWAWDAFNTQVQGAPPGHALLGFMYGGNYQKQIRLARIRLTLPPSALERTIHLQWTTLPPHNIAMVSSFERVVIPPGSFPPWEPRLFPCRAIVTGDLQEDGGISSADVILLVNYTFKGTAPPGPCAAAADVDCSGTVTSSDVIKLVNHVFKGGAKPCNVCALVADGVWTCP